MQRHQSDFGSHSPHPKAPNLSSGPDRIPRHGFRNTAIGRHARILATALRRVLTSCSRSLGWRIMNASVSDLIAAAQSWDKAPLPAHSSRPGGAIGGFAKRLTDVVIASIALVALAPLMLTIAALVRLTMGGPAIFAHTRVGLNGRAFRCYKFRTMINGAEDHLSHYLTQNPELNRQWQEAQKLGRDPRITTFGALLRKSSLDELPQLFNVLRGDMSCVGPRPIVSTELDRYGADVQHYLRSRPGLTGLWQISGRSNVSYGKRVVLDSLYVRNWSMLLDLAILIRTIPALLKFDDAT